MRERISLYGDDADWFAELKEEVAERRNGHEPSNAEMTRILMEKYGSGGSSRRSR